MNQFFAEQTQIEDGLVHITGADVNHIRNVLRMRRGEKLRVCIPDGKAYLCEIENVDETEVKARILDLDGTYGELPAQITLYQGLPKGDKMELIIQKAVELGAVRVVPVSMTNCVVKLTEERSIKKTARWQSIAASAAQQSKRGRIPRIENVMDTVCAAEDAAALDLVLVPYEMADTDSMRFTRAVMEEVRPGLNIGVFIGPEGGFDKKEIALIRETCGEKTRIISLGHRILRTETAGLTMLSLLMYHLEAADS